MEDLVASIQGARRKGFLRSLPMWKPFASTSRDEIDVLARNLGVTFPNELCEFLVRLGFGDLNDELSFRRDWLYLINRGPLLGHLAFAQDDRGNAYVVHLRDGAVHYLDRFEPGYCLLAPSFVDFLRQIVSRGFNVAAWAESLPLVPYTDAAT